MGEKERVIGGRENRIDRERVVNRQVRGKAGRKKGR